MIRRALLTVTVFGGLLMPVRGQDNLSLREIPETVDIYRVMEWHEVFTYEAKYGFIKLGEIRVEVVGDTVFNGEQAWHLRGIIRSAPGIPFVGRQENHYNSIFSVSGSGIRELVYWKDDIDDELMEEDRYDYDYSLNKVYSFKEGEARDTLDLEEPATSGPLVFLYSRLLAGADTTSRTFIYLDDKKGTVDMTYFPGRERRSYAAFENEILTLYAEGDADISGPFGFRGNFKAWFGTDELRIPVEAHVKVWLGNVKVRLIDYKKTRRNE